MDRRHRHVIPAGDNLNDRNQLAFALHGLFSYVPQIRQGPLTFFDFRIVPHTLISLEYLIEDVRYLR